MDLRAGIVEKGLRLDHRWRPQAVYELPTKGAAAPFGVDGSSLLIDKTQFLQRWAEHFRGVLSHPSTISDAANDRLPQGETNEDLDLSPSLQETIKAVQRLFSRKTSGSGTITAETHKHGCPKLMNHPIALFGRCGVKENSRMI
ncbi:hypothetical protein SprV_0602228900 [Sparganum proliferum]